MKVRLSAAGNPDWDEPKNIGIKPRWVAVSSLKEASARVVEFLEEHNLGAGNWTGGDVVDASGKKIARISFNGRAWMPGPYPQPEIALENQGEKFRVSVVAPADPLGVERSVAIQPCKSNKECVAAAKYFQSEARNLVPGTQIHIQNKNADGVWRTLVQYDYLVLQSEWRRTYR